MCETPLREPARAMVTYKKRVGLTAFQLLTTLKFALTFSKFDNLQIMADLTPPLGP